MKAFNVNDRKVEDFREDGRAPFDGSRRQTAHESPSDPERVYPIDRFGYARTASARRLSRMPATTAGTRPRRSRTASIASSTAGLAAWGREN